MEVSTLCVCVCVSACVCVYMCVSVCGCLCLSVCMHMCVANINGSVLNQTSIWFVCSVMQLVQLNILCIHIIQFSWSWCQTILYISSLANCWNYICYTKTVLRGLGSGIASPYIDYSLSLTFAMATGVCTGDSYIWNFIGSQSSQHIHWYATLASPNKSEQSVCESSICLLGDRGKVHDHWSQVSWAEQLLSSRLLSTASALQSGLG